MESKYLNFLLDENEINKIAKEVGLCRRIRTFTPIELLKMVVFYPNNIAKDILDEISLNLFEISSISVSNESINKRFNSTFVKFLKAIFLELLNIKLNVKKPEKNILEPFKASRRKSRIFSQNFLLDFCNQWIQPFLWFYPFFYVFCQKV